MKQSSQAKDILAIYRTYIEKALRRLKREIDNLVVIMTPWEMRIKKIESQVKIKKLRRSTYFVMHLITDLHIIYLVWICGRKLLYVFEMDFLDKYFYWPLLCDLRHGTGSCMCDLISI